MMVERTYQEYNSEKLELELAKLAKDNTLTCRQAHQLAIALGVEPVTVGRAAAALKIKIADCQLGCFGRYKGR